MGVKRISKKIKRVKNLMRQRKIFIFFFFLILSLFFSGIIFRFTRKKPVVQPSFLPILPTPTIVSDWVEFNNKKYGFSLSYPLTWNPPEEKEISPPQQHLKQFILDSGKEEYLVDVYEQSLPVSLSSFVRDYFDEASWIKENQPAVQFFIPKMGAEPVGIAGIAFQKKGLVLTISTPIKNVPGGDLKSLVNEPILTQMVESFRWTE